MRVQRRLATALACLIPLAAMVLPAHTSAAPAAGPMLRVGVVLDIGGRDDKGFNQLAYEGAIAAQKQYGIQFKYVQTTIISDQLYYQNLSTFARQNFDLVIGVGFLMSKAIYKAAKAYPKVRFGIVDSSPADAKGNSVNLPNVANLYFREQESGYLVGYMAGLLEKNKVGKATNGVIGAMGGLSIPPVNRYIAGYVQGARAADPGLKIKLNYSQDFNDQGKALNIGNGQIAAKADILFAVAGGAGLGYLKAAQKAGLYGIGVDADQAYLGSFMVTSAVKRVDKAVLLTIGAVKDGTFKAGDNIFSLQNDATGYGKVGAFVPQAIKDQVAAQAKLIQSGKLVPTTVIPKDL